MAVSRSPFHVRSPRWYAYIFSHSRKIETRFFVIRVCADIERIEPGAGWVISRAYAKKAVERNRIKRILREAIRTLPAPLSVGIVCIPKRNGGLQEASGDAILKDIHESA